MSDLSQDQTEKRAAIQKTATIWGAVVGVVAGLLALWLLGGQGGAVRYGGAAVVALVAGVLVHRASFNAGAKTARCAKCGAAFSRSRTDRAETLAGSEAKEERQVQPDNSTEVTTWTEERYDVVDTYSCAKCGDTTTQTYQTTRRRDVKTEVEPAAPPEAAAQLGGWGTADAPGQKPAAPAKPAKAAAKGKSGRSGRGKR